MSCGLAPEGPSHPVVSSLPAERLTDEPSYTAIIQFRTPPSALEPALDDLAVAVSAAVERDDVAEDFPPAGCVAGVPLSRGSPVRGVDDVEQPAAVRHAVREREPVGRRECGQAVGGPRRRQQEPLRRPVRRQVGHVQVRHPVLRVSDRLPNTT